MKVIAHYANGLQRVIPCETSQEAVAAIKAALTYDRAAKFTLDKRLASAIPTRAASERVWLLSA
ncbi:hypothetical protein CcrC1_gp540 [Caulobacter phage C1]|nr:hypothetical protein CcrC1_gp047 [Caulobacter phage C1]UTU08274.1 hypothetical protein CcrC2_gp046 [Caulobacter phage C2]UTU08797.1 hypothetical protein CcrJ4_gp046 [Caulobacter phage J4]UTU09337.1 hypothetical protein CcrBL47_gp051 [Caulobacter phage BL47]UTU09909.1 hypothetical protein CcrRB23_gp047 [Caulobacter phage RB23]WGN96934.1 hypothetical protein [Bertelyvirus sp.]